MSDVSQGPRVTTEDPDKVRRRFAARLRQAVWEASQVMTLAQIDLFVAEVLREIESEEGGMSGGVSVPIMGAGLVCAVCGVQPGYDWTHGAFMCRCPGECPRVVPAPGVETGDRMTNTRRGAR